MKLSTMAAVMSFVSKLESESASFYEARADKYPEFKETFRKWVKENKRFEKQVKQTYFGVITDTLESNFSFGDLDTDDYELETSLPDDASETRAREKADTLELTIRNFYLNAARFSEGLMADIPRLFKKIARKRDERRALLTEKWGG
jgi:triphosphoribosyl-dephospho-CoA synthetase